MISSHRMRPLIALLGGVVATVAARTFAITPQASDLASDIAKASGFPVDTTLVLSWPVGVLLLVGLCTWTVWICMEIRSFLVQVCLLLATVALCLTGSWLAWLGEGEFPTLSVLFGLGSAFILGQFAAGFNGSARSQIARDLLSQVLAPAERDRVAQAAESQAQFAASCLVVVIEIPDADKAFVPTLKHGLLADGACVTRANDGRLHCVFGLFAAHTPETQLDATALPEHIVASQAAMARVAKALAERPVPWTMATSLGPVQGHFELDAQPAFFLRGAALSRCLLWLDSAADNPASTPPETFQWVFGLPSPYIPSGWELVPGERPNTVPVRLRATPQATPKAE